MKRMAFVVFSTLLTLLVPASAQRATDVSGEDPLLGTWRLNVSRSTYTPGPPPQSKTRIYEKHQFGIRVTVNTIQADGRSTTAQSVYDYDRQDRLRRLRSYPVTGSEEVDAIVVKRIDAYTHEGTLSRAGREIGTFRWEISRDGKQMTVTIRRRTPPADNAEVYEKVVDDRSARP